MYATESQLELALSLLGKYVRFRHDPPIHLEDSGYLVTDVTRDGLLELRGWVGEFAPHLFVVVARPPSRGRW
jgi:hypothetical protein